MTMPEKEMFYALMHAENALEALTDPQVKDRQDMMQIGERALARVKKALKMYVADDIGALRSEHIGR